MDNSPSNLITDEYVVPQRVKVVKLAEHQQQYSNGSLNSRGPGVRPQNNIYLIGSPEDDTNQPPPIFIDNHTPECFHGLEYDELNHKFASFTLSTPCQPDDPVDFFSSSSSLKPMRKENGSFSKSIHQPFPSKNNKSTTFPSEEEDSKPGPTLPLSTVLEHMSSCGIQFCHTPVKVKCGYCRSKEAVYCSDEHYFLDWKRHRKDCVPFRIRFVGFDAADDKSPVNAATASRDIAEGETIFEERPLVVFSVADPIGEGQIKNVMEFECVLGILKGEEGWRCESKHPACLGCAKIIDNFTWGDESRKDQCSQCGVPMCGNCYHGGGAHSGGECIALRSLTVDVPDDKRCLHNLYMDIEILRVLQLDKYDQSSLYLIMGMRNNVRVDHYKQSPHFQLFSKHMDTLVPYSVKISGYNRDLIADVHAIVSSLSYRPNVNCPVKFLFNIQPQFDHSCIPNTFSFIEEEQSYEAKRMKLVTKAAEGILSGGVLTVDFTPSPYLSYQRRRKVLANVLSITNCMCRRCGNMINDLTAEISCGDCPNGTVCPESPQLWKESVWSCRVCQQEVPFSRIDQVESTATASLSTHLTTARKTGSIQPLLSFITDYTNEERGYLLNPKHHLILTAWCYIEALLRRRSMQCRSPDPSRVYTDEEFECLQVLGQYADVVLDHMEQVRPGVWIDKGIAKIHKFYSSFSSSSRDYQIRKTSQKTFITNVLKCLKILQEALKTLQHYEGYETPCVRHLTQEATAVLFRVKKYIEKFMQLDEEGAYPLPELGRLLEEYWGPPV